MSCSPNSPSDRLSTSSTPNGKPSPWGMTFHGTADSMLDEQFRSSKSLFIFEMIGNHWLTGLEGVAKRRYPDWFDRRVADHFLAPSDASANKQPLVCRNVLHDFADTQRLGLRPSSARVIEQIGEARALQGQDPEFGEQLLLPNT